MVVVSLLFSGSNCLRLLCCQSNVASTALKLLNQLNNRHSYVVWWLFAGLLSHIKGIKKKEGAD